MSKFFNTAGPINSQDHYCLPPLERFNLSEIETLIAQKKYFVLHAPRQTGKTSALLALMKYLNQREQYRCLYVNVEAAQGARENVGRGVHAILTEIANRANDFLHDSFLLEHVLKILAESGEDTALNIALSRWAQNSPQPIVLLIDEIDALIGDTLISVLRQLWSGYDKRPANFPQTIILCGVRDVRDYRIHSQQEKAIITGGSAFNIKAESLRLGNFSLLEVRSLYQQHTTETGQPFAEEIFPLVWELTRGQPWLVNALAYEVCFRMTAGRDRSQPITVELIQEAKEQLILRRETHLDQLVDKLREERVRRVIEPILAGADSSTTIPTDDIMYVRDLGLIDTVGQLRIANRIYQEVIPRELTYSEQLTIAHQTAWYVLPDGQLDMKKLLTAFQQFFRENSEHWVERFDYKEAGPQLLMQAFLQRIVNSGGRVEREYGLGSKRTDLLVIWRIGETANERIPDSRPPTPDSRPQLIVIELKILHGKLETTITEGIKQTWEYMDKCGAAEGHLVIFDRSEDKSWAEKIFRRKRTHKKQAIQVWGM